MSIYPNTAGPKSVLVIKPSSFGDVIHTIPAVSRLKAAWPDAHLAWIINPEWAPLLKDNPFIDEIVPFPRREFHGLSGLVKFVRWCQQTVSLRRPELVIDFQGLLRSALIGRASKGKYLVGMSDAREGSRLFYDHVVQMPAREPHAVERYLAAVDALLSKHALKAIKNKEKICWRLPAGIPVANFDKNKFSDGFILLNPFARGQGKSLNASDILQLCKYILPRRVVIVGQAREPFHDQLPDHCLSLLGQTSLEQLIWLARKASFVITVDSGPSHLAAALKRPLIAIHMWSDPRKVGPYCKNAWIWKNGRLLQMSQLGALDKSFFDQKKSRPNSRDFKIIATLATSS